MDDKHGNARDREYYAERSGRVGSLSFEQIKTLFRETLDYIAREDYLMEAAGFKYREAIYYGIWGRDVSAFILRQLKMENIWPFEEHLHNYDEYTFFSVVEFIYDYISKKVPKRGYKPSFEKAQAQRIYLKKVNEILKLRTVHITSIDKVQRKIVYELSEDGEIREKVQEGFEKLIEEMPATDDPENIDERIQYAISRFLRYGAVLEEKKDAIFTLGAVLEFLRGLNIKMSKPDDKDLRKILNGFSIRHHKREQKGDYTHEAWYEFMFYLFLSSINVLLKLREIGE